MATRIREKAKVRRENADKRPRAIARYVRISSSKVGIVADLIRGKKADDALAILMYTPKAAAPVMEKLLLSAIANAAHNNNVQEPGLLKVKICVLDESVRMRRYWPTARGSAHPIARRLCHCKVVLTDAGKEAR